MYADDTQLYAVIRPEEHDVGLQKLQQCIADVKEWSLQNNLQLNDSKTEVIHVFSRFRGARILPVLQIGDGTSIGCVQASRDLGVILDKNLTMADHIRSKSRAAAFGISKIGKIRKYLTASATERLVHAFVSSHLDYCNSLFYGLPDSHVLPLQRIQNAAARLITRSRKYDNITPVLRSLHWLPVSQRITFKILILTYKAQHELAPLYITELISPKTQTTSIRLRSSTYAHLQLAPGPRTRTRYGDRAFSVAAPRLWNRLPLEIREAPSLDSFKSSLKTFLFNSPC